jgi:hypothetical protein
MRSPCLGFYLSVEVKILRLDLSPAIEGRGIKKAQNDKTSDLVRFDRPIDIDRMGNNYPRLSVFICGLNFMIYLIG